ncbi:MAG TPA: hypothetical protein VE664_00405 [Actinomycetes bacterium]|nr:hypothetical protein [Actinomycetes bacterium]
MPTADHDPDALDVLDSSFRLLVSGPSPLAIDGAAPGHGLPARLIPARSAPRDTDDGLVFRVEPTPLSRPPARSSAWSATSA